MLLMGVIFLVPLSQGSTVSDVSEPNIPYVLSDRCPPSFDKVEGRCKFVSLYNLYGKDQQSLGLRRALPAMRDDYTPQQIDLGRYLFFDPILSADKTMACASCHLPEKGFADGRPVSIGANSKDLIRAAPSLWNVGFAPRLFWDSRELDLENQAKSPLFSDVEMANTPKHLLPSLKQTPIYVELFQQAFPDSSDGINVEKITQALAAFQASLVSLNSAYDRYAHGDENALTDNQKQGHSIFRSFVARCSQCHSPPLFTNQESAAIGAPDADGRGFDKGVGGVNSDPNSLGAFKIPSLRNISLTAPYMHNGQFESLDEVVEFYNKPRGHALPDKSPVIVHWHLLHPDLTKDELKALVAFLHSLEDETMMPKIPATVPSGLPVIASKSNILSQSKE